MDDMIFVYDQCRHLKPLFFFVYNEIIFEPDSPNDKSSISFTSIITVYLCLTHQNDNNRPVL